MKQQSTQINRKNQKGFTILEMLFTTAILVFIMMMLFDIFENYAEKELARSTSEFVDEISLSVENIIEDPAAFQDLYDYLIVQPGNIMDLTIADLTTGFNVSGAMTHRASSLNTNIINRTALGNGLFIMLRIGDDITIDTDTESLQIIIATDDVAAETRVRQAARFMGSYGGYYIDASEDIKSAFAVWSLDADIFDTTNLGSQLSLTAPSTDVGGYLIHYKHINFANIAGDYIYRDRIQNRPELNQMNAPLNMAGNNILGIDNAEVTNDLDLAASAFINGNARIGGEAVFNESNFTAGQKMSATNATINGATTGYSGNFAVQGDLKTAGIDTDGPVNADSSRFENNVTINGDLQTNTSSFNSLVVNGDSTIGEITSTGQFDINAANNINAINVTTNELNVNNSSLGAFNLSTSGQTTLNNVDANQAFFELLSLQGTFGACDRGC